jgi:hypothetical protein
MKLAERVTYCAACHGQYLERDHVDFEAYYDGPVIEGTDHGYVMTVDDLIICDKCLSDAGKLVGLFPAEELKKENKELGLALENAEDDFKKLEEFCSDLERTLANLTDQKIKRPPRKPRILAKA